MTNSFNDLENTDLLFVIGSNPTEAHPIVGTKMHKAIQKGAKLIVVDPRKTEIAEKADIWLAIKPGTDIALLNGMMKIIVDEGWLAEDFVKNRTENLEELINVIKHYDLAKVSEITGVSSKLIFEAAKLYANTYYAAICYTLGITEHIVGTNNVMTIANIAMLTGHIGREKSGVNPLRGQNNVQGACDVGGLPDFYPGYQKVIDSKINKKFSLYWNKPLSAKMGLTIPQMLDEAVNNNIKAMYIMGEDPVLSDPNANHVKKALKSLEFLVVQDLFMTETAKYADVFLPAASFAEKDGTFTNSERRVQRVRKAIEPLGNSKPDWEIICEISNRLGYPMNYDSPEEIFQEIANVTPIYAGIDYQRIDKSGIQWPCPTKDHPGTAVLHVEKFSRGKGKFVPVDHFPPYEIPDDKYPFLLSTGRRLYHYNVTTQYSLNLMSYRPEEIAMINPDDAKFLNINNGDRIRITSRRGEVTAKVEITDRIQPRMIWLSFHYKETPTNELTNGVFDPISYTGEYKVAAVKIEKVL